MSSDNVVQFGAFSSARQPAEEHFAGEAKCLACKHEWLAVVTVESDDGTSCGMEGNIECPACGCHRGQFKWPFGPQTSEEVWTCNCGGSLFMITRPGTRCVSCGKHAVFNIR